MKPGDVIRQRTTETTGTVIYVRLADGRVVWWRVNQTARVEQEAA